MLTSKKELKMIGLILLGLLFLTGFAVFCNKNIDTLFRDVPVLSFSVESGFYEKGFSLQVSSRKKGDIYYTMDGSEPDRENRETTYLYQEPILVENQEDMKAIVYRFRLYQKNGVDSEIITKSFFIGEGVSERFDTLVMSISTADDNLYGYENGIFIEGKIRDEYVAEHPLEEVDADTPSNYNLRGRESERKVHLDVFEASGKHVINQDCGIRTSGGVTRESEQKSFKLYSRREYGGEHKFEYPFFQDAYSDKRSTLVDRYECLKIRNTGNDRLQAFIRDELGMRLVKDENLQDLQYVRPVSVFINGVYKGLYWIHSVYEEGYFKEKYGDYTGQMVVLGRQEGNMSTSSTKEIENVYGKAYNEWYEEVCDLDMKKEENFQRVLDTIDIENYLSYMAAEVYMANQDWPFNNEKVYRYVAEDEVYQEDSVFDGRYRYLIYDVDTAMGAGMIMDTMNPDQSFERLQYLIEQRGSALFAALMEREDLQKEFASNLCTLMNGAFSYQHVCDVLDTMEMERANEMNAYVEESIRNQELTEISPYYTGMQTDCIREWARVTPDNLLQHLSEYWDLGSAYQLGVILPEGSAGLVNDLSLSEGEFLGKYLSKCDMVLEAVVPKNQEFQGWMIQGKPYYEKKVRITEDMIEDGRVLAVLVTNQKTTPELAVTAFSAKSENDYIIVSNIGNVPVSAKEYYVADKEKSSHKNYLPDIEIAPGEHVKIICRSYYLDAEDAVLRTNFNLNEKEHVILGKGIDDIIDYINVPKLTQKNGYYERDIVSDEWKEVLVK